MNPLAPACAQHRSRRFCLLLAIVVLAACAPIEETDEDLWIFEDEESSPEPAVEPDEPRPPEAEGPQIPQTDPNRDCPEFHSHDPEQFDFDLYRHLACHRDPDESLVFSPALVRIALAEAAESAPEADASHIVHLLGHENLDELVAYAEHLRDQLLSRRPLPASTRQPSGHGSYDIVETDLDTLQRALGVEFYSTSCTDECQWLPQNRRWTDSSFHTLSPSAEYSPNDTRSMILRAQVEAIAEPSDRELPFTTATGDSMPYRPWVSELYHWIRTDLGHALDWRPVGGQFAFLVFRPHDHIPLETLEEQLSTTLIDDWVPTTSEWGFRMVLRTPAFHIEEQIDLEDVTTIEGLRTTTAIAIGPEGINMPEPVELDLSLTNPPRQRGFVGSSGLGAINLWSPFLFVVYDRELEEILLLGRVARPF